MTLALIVQGIALGFGDLGVAGALVQRKHITNRHVRTGFTFSVILGLTLAAVTAMAAPLAATIMEEPRITPLLRWLSLGFAIQGAGVVGGALLRRDLDYKRRFLINTFSYLAGYACVTIVLASLATVSGAWCGAGWRRRSCPRSDFWRPLGSTLVLCSPAQSFTTCSTTASGCPWRRG